MAYTYTYRLQPTPIHTVTSDLVDIIPRTFYTNFQMTFQSDLLPRYLNSVQDDSYNFTSVFNRWDEYQIVFLSSQWYNTQGQLTVEVAVTVKDMYSRGNAETTVDRKGLLRRLFKLLYRHYIFMMLMSHDRFMIII